MRFLKTQTSSDVRYKLVQFFQFLFARGLMITQQLTRYEFYFWVLFLPRYTFMDIGIYDDPTKQYSSELWPAGSNNKVSCRQLIINSDKRSSCHNQMTSTPYDSTVMEWRPPYWISAPLAFPVLSATHYLCNAWSDGLSNSYAMEVAPVLLV